MATISEQTLDERNGAERPVLDRATAERTKAVDAAILWDGTSHAFAAGCHAGASRASRSRTIRDPEGA